MDQEPSRGKDLASAIRARFAPLGGVELELPSRGTRLGSIEETAMIVLDTNVVSDLMLPRPTASVIEWVAEQAASSLYLSTISEAEMRYGVAILPTGQRRERLLAEIEGMLDVSTRTLVQTAML